MAGDSQATFSLSVKNAIRRIYHYHSTPGLQQLRNAVELGVLSEDYERNSETNGMVQCPTCHTYFTNNYVVFSLPIPVLKYLENYVAITPKADRRPLHEVFDLLVDASHGAQVKLPSAKAIFPYLGLFTMLTINPAAVAGFDIQTPHLPNLSTICDTKFVKAPPNTSTTAKNVARIFDSLALDNTTPQSRGRIPLSTQNQDFTEMRYWQLPVSPAAIFAALIERLENDSSGCEDIKLAKNIHSILDLQSRDAYPPDQNNGGNGPSAGGGPSGGNRRPSKRKGAGTKKGKKKARKTSGAGDCGEVGELRQGVLSQNGQAKHREIMSSTLTPDDVPVQLIGTGCDNSDPDSGRSISAISPHDQDNPDEWRFGPSFTTNKIIFTAMAVNLT